MSQSSTLRRRTDATRNRTKILNVAREAFLEAQEPSMAEVARRAGVGMATLYRNFPGRTELLAEVYRTEIEDICEAAAVAEGDDPGKRLLAWLTYFHDAGLRKGPLISLLRSDSGDGESVVTGSRSLVIRAGEPLLAAAQKAGEVRADVSIREVLDAIAALGQVGGDDPAPAQAVVGVFLDGLRTQGEAPSK